jgi:hypothetical protein
MSLTSGFGVIMTCTAAYAPFLVASAATLRRHNTTTPVVVVSDPTGVERVAPVADRLGIELVRAEPRWMETVRSPDGEAERIRSRLMKIESLAAASFDPVLYLDCDTIVRDDIAKIVDELGPALANGADMFSLLHRPVAPTLWGDRRLYFPDAEISRVEVVRRIGDIYAVDLAAVGLDQIVCWNSGIIMGRRDAMRRIGGRWLELYRRMLASPHREQIIPRDQLGFWLSLWERRDQVRVAEMPVRWNFMAAQLLGLPPGADDLDEAAIDGAAILHLAGYKFDPWAVRRVQPVLAALPEAPALRLPSGRPPVW